ncbi:hypothetical protein ACF0H5_009696 [Mactra antiquata]
MNISTVFTIGYHINGSHINTTFSPDEQFINETLEELDARYSSTLLPLAVLFGILCVIGVLGNIGVIAVFCFSKEYRNTNFKIFVLFLAAIDLLSCVALMPAEMIKTKHYFSFSNPLPCKVKCFFNIFAMCAAAFSLFVICIDRYRKVCLPLKKQIWPDLAVKIMMGVTLLSMLLALPAPIMCGISTVTMTNLYGQNITAYTCAAEEEYKHSAVRYIYKFGMAIILLLVSVAFIVMYTLIMKTVVKHWCRRESASSIRFEPSRTSDNTADKVEAERLTNCDDVFIKEEVSIPEHDNRKSSTHRKIDKRPSNSSMSSSSTKGRWSVKRSGSDASFRSRSVRRRSSAPGPGKLPYKTLIWFILTVVFLVTFFVNSGLSFLSTKEHIFSPVGLAVYLLFYRFYFINNMINPIIYGILDKRFKTSCKSFFQAVKSNFCCK